MPAAVIGIVILALLALLVLTYFIKKKGFIKTDKLKKGQGMGTGIGIGMGIGMPTGLALGIAMDNVALGISLGPAMGAGFGTAIGAALESRIEGEKKEISEFEKKSLRIALILGITLLAAMVLSLSGYLVWGK